MLGSFFVFSLLGLFTGGCLSSQDKAAASGDAVGGIVKAGVKKVPFVYPKTTRDVSDISFYKQRIGDLKPMVAKRPKNVILLIGDGMGLGQVTLARLKALGSGGYLGMEKMPYTGLVHTHSANDSITDSASSATAFACGVKTNNGMIGMSPSGQRYASILTLLQGKGFRTGLVATSTITHATPAAFGAHVPRRGQEGKIATQLLAGRINVLLGGGREHWIAKSQKLSKRKDQRDLIEEAKAGGYAYVQTRKGLEEVSGSHVLGLFSLGTKGMTTFWPEPSLVELAQRAIELLDHRVVGSAGAPPFFLMIEGSQIDWAGHGNEADNVVKQTLLFDMAVQAALAYAQRAGDTLVIVTADHETGGLSIVRPKYKIKKNKAAWSTKFHTPIAVPLYAYGPGAAAFTGTFDNTQIPVRIAALLGVKDFPRKIK